MTTSPKHVAAHDARLIAAGGRRLQGIRLKPDAAAQLARMEAAGETATAVLNRLLNPGWQPASTAPHDRMIIANVGGMYAHAVIWSEYDRRWNVAYVQGNICEGLDDPWFVNEQELTIKAWQELPALELGK